MFLDANQLFTLNLALTVFFHAPLLVCLQWTIYIELANRIIKCWTDETLNIKESQIKTLHKSYQKLLSIIDQVHSSFKFSSRIIYFNFLLTFIILIYSMFVLLREGQQYDIGIGWFFFIGVMRKLTNYNNLTSIILLKDFVRYVFLPRFLILVYMIKKVTNFEKSVRLKATVSASLA